MRRILAGLLFLTLALTAIALEEAPGRPTFASGRLVSTNGALRPGGNAVVWQEDRGLIVPASVVVKAAETAARGMSVDSLWLLADGAWRFHLPEAPESSTLNAVPPVASLYVVLSTSPAASPLLSTRQPKASCARAGGRCTVVEGEPAYVFGPGVGAAEQQRIRGALEDAGAYTRARLGYDFAQFRADVFADLDTQVDEFLLATGQLPAIRAQVLAEWAARNPGGAPGTAQRGYLLVCICDAAMRPFTAAHEFFHVLQLELSPAQLGPVWLFEGVAEYLSLRVAEASSWATEGGPPSIDAQARLAAATSALLRSMETRHGFESVGIGYAAGVAAVKLLADSAGEASLIRFFELLGRGGAWEDAFRDAFGRSAGRFYAEYEARPRDR